MTVCGSKTTPSNVFKIFGFLYTSPPYVDGIDTWAESVRRSEKAMAAFRRSRLDEYPVAQSWPLTLMMTWFGLELAFELSLGLDMSEGGIRLFRPTHLLQPKISQSLILFSKIS